jgi:hypothetical protein
MLGAIVYDIHLIDPLAEDGASLIREEVASLRKKSNGVAVSSSPPSASAKRRTTVRTG